MGSVVTAITEQAVIINLLEVRAKKKPREQML